MASGNRAAVERLGSAQAARPQLRAWRRLHLGAWEKLAHCQIQCTSVAHREELQRRQREMGSAAVHGNVVAAPAPRLRLGGGGTLGYQFMAERAARFYGAACNPGLPLERTDIVDTATRLLVVTSTDTELLLETARGPRAIQRMCCAQQAAQLRRGYTSCRSLPWAVTGRTAVTNCVLQRTVCVNVDDMQPDMSRLDTFVFDPSNGVIACILMIAGV